MSDLEALGQSIVANSTGAIGSYSVAFGELTLTGPAHRVVEALTQLARQKGATPAQLALAWLLAQGDDIVPIPGTTKLSRVKENVAAADIVLTPQDLAAIAAAVPETAVEGARYNESGMAMLGR